MKPGLQGLEAYNAKARSFIALPGPNHAESTRRGSDSSKPDKIAPMTVRHFFPVPEATYNEKTWRRWIFEQCRRLENHELGEWFRIDDERPFQPLHGPGEDPYTVHEFRPEVDGLTTQDGSVREPYRTTSHMED